MADTELPPAETSREIEVLDFDRLYQSDPDHFLILDVREPEETEFGTLPGSLCIPLAQVTDKTAEVVEAAAGRSIVVVCRSGVRSLQAQEHLQEFATAGVVSLKGGLKKFVAEAGLDITIV